MLLMAFEFSGSLHIDVHLDCDIDVVEKFRPGLDVLAICLEQSGKGVLEGMPADPADLAGNTGGLGGGLKMSPLQSASAS